MTREELVSLYMALRNDPSNPPEEQIIRIVEISTGTSPVIGHVEAPSLERKNFVEKKDPLGDLVVYSPLPIVEDDTNSSQPEGILSWWCPLCNIIHGIPVSHAKHFLSHPSKGWPWNGSCSQPHLEHCIHGLCSKEARTFIAPTSPLSKPFFNPSLLPNWEEASQELEKAPYLYSPDNPVPTDNPIPTMSLLKVERLVERIWTQAYLGPMLPVKYWSKTGEFVSVHKVSSPRRAERIRSLLDRC